jgi:hypothetical protein
MAPSFVPMDQDLLSFCLRHRGRLQDCSRAVSRSCPLLLFTILTQLINRHMGQGRTNGVKANLSDAQSVPPSPLQNVF